MKVWDVASGQALRTLKGHTTPVRSVAFSPDGTRLATSSADNEVKVWHAASGQELRTLQGPSVAFSPDGMQPGAGERGWDGERMGCNTFDSGCAGTS